MEKLRYGEMSIGNDMSPELEPQNYLGETVKELRNEIRRFMGMSDFTIPHTVVEPVIDDEYAEIFPAVHEFMPDGQLKVYFHEDTVREKSDTYDYPSSTYHQLVRIYVGGSMINGAISEHFRGSSQENQDKLYETYMSIDPLLHLIDAHEDYDKEQKIALKSSLMASQQNDHRRVLAIAMQRLSTSILEVVYDETEVMFSLREKAEADLHQALVGHKQIQNIFLAGGTKPDTVETITNARFTDAVSETTIALCFPMGIEEMHTILSACKNESAIFDEQQIFDENDGDGFTIDDH